MKGFSLLVCQSDTKVPNVSLIVNALCTSWHVQAEGRDLVKEGALLSQSKLDFAC